MAAFNPKSHDHYRLRSVSLPTRSHPSAVKIEQVMNKLKTLEISPSSSKADMICNSLLGLRELFEAIQELLTLPLTQQSLSKHQEDNRVNELVEESVVYIDVCSNTRDTVMQLKQVVRGLQSSFRRNKLGELSIENHITAFLSSRKNFQEEISGSLSKLKNIDSRVIPPQLFNSEDHQASAVLKALIEASLLTISTFSSLLLFLSVPVGKSKPTRWSWSLVSKLMYRGALAWECQRSSLNELENVDIALGDLLLLDSRKDTGKERIESAQRKLEVLETLLESLEYGLEVLFRHLINARVSLLNILSQ